MKVLVVCLGNICRSPMAEGILREIVRKKGLGWKVDSAGTSGFHSGESPDTRAANEMQKRGYNIAYQRSRQFSVSDLMDYDHILVMDEANYNNVVSLTNSDLEREKVEKLLKYYPESLTQEHEKTIQNEGEAIYERLNSYQSSDVPDPYYNDGFDLVFHLLKASLENFVEAHQ